MEDLLARINYDYPGLEQAKTLYENGDAEGAMDAVIAHFRTRTSPKYLFTAKELEACKVDGLLRRWTTISTATSLTARLTGSSTRQSIPPMTTSGHGRSTAIFTGSRWPAPMR